jgi:HlyD family secretion protein
MKGGADSDQLALLEAQLNAAKAGVAAFEVLAPFDSVVAELSARQGASINSGEIAVTVADFSSWIIRTTDLTELDVVTVKEGQATTITLDALPGVRLNGQIESIGQTYEEKQGDVVYAVTVALKEGHPDLRWGMTAIVTFKE